MTQKAYIRHSEQLISLIFFVKSFHKKSKACLDTYAAIARYWNPQGNIFPSQNTLAELVGVQPRTIRTHISQLKKMKLLDFHQPNSKGQPPKSNQYTFVIETLKLWVEEAKKERRALNRQLKQERQQVLEAKEKPIEEHDPTPPLKNDPPITPRYTRKIKIISLGVSPQLFWILFFEKHI
ncbi:helix-turn-helix domain-containing protein [Vibrio sonorensis]|uniref:helix-turn-helix domain-containing protein n=1 Tax=Vibrio sonorensis TaxID=1004316 RepID=UPI0008DB239B|nr:helix-turn-helix domain-containing protein [Vibrio sonorensis]